MSQLLPVIMRIMTLMAVLRIIYEGSGEMSDNERDTYADGSGGDVALDVKKW